ncbi:hypothetical protein BDR07DRAFT_1378331 [Suillus spraguei]|nr:hypothetical protein BDR07DRAFT_1378868 [Suillus spraguei]KAG2359910.1 hypothetical protein BDR07DRAFT_1378331 [Suillus spraguei]
MIKPFTGLGFVSEEWHHPKETSWPDRHMAIHHQEFEDDLESFINLTVHEDTAYLQSTFDEVREKNDLLRPFWVDLLTHLNVGQYNKKLDKLKSSSWFPSTIRACLKNIDLRWPTNDKAERLLFAAKSGATKKQEANRINSKDEARAHSRFPGELNHSAGWKSTTKENSVSKRRKVA